MVLGGLIELLTLALALTGLLLQPRRNPIEPPSWRNLNQAGRLVLVLLVLLSFAKLLKGQRDAVAQRESAKASAQKLEELESTNQRLIKVMSVAGGYNALLSGIVVFRQVPSDQKVRDALQNLFLKFAEVDITASNALGTYEGRVDYGSHPEVRRFLSLQHIHDDQELVAWGDFVPTEQRPRAFYYEIRCANLKILNPDKIQYVRFSPSDRMQASAKIFNWWSDFQSLYGVQSLYIDNLTIEELGVTPIQRTF